MVGSGIVFKALADYEKQRRSKINPVFKASDIGLDTSKLDYWK